MLVSLASCLLSQLKQENRRAEFLLRDVDFLCAVDFACECVQYTP